MDGHVDSDSIKSKQDASAEPLVLTVLGCGTLGSAILSGILDSIYPIDHRDAALSAAATDSLEADMPDRTPGAFIACVSRPSSAKRLGSELKQHLHRIKILQNENLKGVQQADIVLLACKPQMARDILSEPGMREALAGKLLISILAGVPVSQIEEILYGGTSESEASCKIVRVMPNTASLHRESMTVIANSTPPLSPGQAVLTTWMFTRIGRVVHLPSSAMDAATALCGSGPAFCALMLEAMADGAVAMGIPRAEAQEMAAQTMRGCAGMVLKGQHPAIVREKVSTPGGCTIGGLLVLEEGSLRGTVARGVREATVVASQLGKGLQGVNGTWGR